MKERYNAKEGAADRPTDRRERSLPRFSLARGEKDLVAVKILSPVNYGAMLQHMVGLLFFETVHQDEQG